MSAFVDSTTIAQTALCSSFPVYLDGMELYVEESKRVTVTHSNTTLQRAKCASIYNLPSTTLPRESYVLVHVCLVELSVENI